MRRFHTAGPCEPRLHYMVPPIARLPRMRSLVERLQYFSVHGSRQTGKSTALAALADELTADGGWVALRVSCERAEDAGDDYGAAEVQILAAIRDAAELRKLPGESMPPSSWPLEAPGSRLVGGLCAWARRCPLPLALFFDNVDALRGKSLSSVLRQLRDGFTARPDSFPASVILCGLRDVPADPFNVKAKSLVMDNFSVEEMRGLYAQHTAESGQPFTDTAIERAFGHTQGQPRLVNALAREAIERMRVQPTDPVTATRIDQAKERLVLVKAALPAKLDEPRVRRVVEPLIAGAMPVLGGTFDDDVSYARDLGVVAHDNPLRVANPIYRAAIARALGTA